jgi:hypothetical protein
MTPNCDRSDAGDQGGAAVLAPFVDALRDADGARNRISRGRPASSAWLAKEFRSVHHDADRPLAYADEVAPP